MCEASRFIKARAKKNFRMSPLAVNGSLVVRRRGRKHVTKWSGDPTKSSLGRSLEECRGGRAAGIGTGRDATPTGRLFGKRLRPRRRAIVGGFLYRNVSGSNCSFVRSLDIGERRATLRMVLES